MVTTKTTRRLTATSRRARPRMGRDEIVTNGEGPHRSRRCQNGTTRNTLSSAMLTTRFLFPKFFPKKFGQKNWGGSRNRKFRECFVYGSGPPPPRHPFAPDERYPVVLPRAGVSSRDFGRDRRRMA